MLAGVVSLIQRGCGGSRAGGAFEASMGWPEQPLPERRYEHLRVRRAASEESDCTRTQRGGFLRKCAWAVPGTVMVLLLVLPFLWLILPAVGPHVFPELARGGAGAHAPVAQQPQGSPFFREKVLVASKPTAPPTTASPSLRLPSKLLGVAAPDAGAGAAGRSSAGGAGAPVEDADHGGGCAPNEELFGGLCYLKCSILTSGTDPIRTSPWTCCKSRPCALNQKGSFGSHVACTGYDIAADGDCPHRPGTCMADEELLFGVCYRKCSLLTDLDFPHRIGPATCCKDSGLSCLDFRKDYTSKEFAVGGKGGATAEQEEACGEDGELLLGVCYKKCGLLTGNKYPLRAAAATCCKAEERLPHKGTDGIWHLGCMDVRKDLTRSEFATRVPGDGSEAHAPLETHAV